MSEHARLLNYWDWMLGGLLVFAAVVAGFTVIVAAIVDGSYRGLRSLWRRYFYTGAHRRR